MASIAAFAHINIAACQFERRIGPHAFDFFNCAIDVKEGRNFNKAANGDNTDNTQ